MIVPFTPGFVVVVVVVFVFLRDAGCGIREIERGIRDENILAGSGCAHFTELVRSALVLKLIAGCGK